MDMKASPRAARTTVVITTYNWPQALRCALAALARQKVLPDEVIVADDGSDDATRTLLQTIARDFPVPLRHSWVEDRGFRVALARNRAIAACSGDYVLLLDGDMVAHAPDGKWIVFRSNMHGPTHVYAVEVAKSGEG